MVRESRRRSKREKAREKEKERRGYFLHGAPHLARLGEHDVPTYPEGLSKSASSDMLPFLLLRAPVARPGSIPADVRPAGS